MNISPADNSNESEKAIIAIFSGQFFEFFFNIFPSFFPKKNLHFFTVLRCAFSTAACRHPPPYQVGPGGGTRVGPGGGRPRPLWDDLAVRLRPSSQLAHAGSACCLFLKLLICI
jgi:hypothetical protein